MNAFFDDRELNAAIETALYKHKMEDKLRESEERFKSLVETTSDWIWEVDENAVYIYVSPKIKDMLGYEPEEVLGLKPFDLMSLDEAKRIADIFGRITASQKEFKNLENINLRKDGTPVILETSGVPVFDAGGVFRGYRGIDRDISARKKAEQERERLNNELEMKNKEMEQLLYITSHDLRTPLAIVQGYAREFEITVNQIVSVIDSSEQAPVLKKRLDSYIKDIQDINTYIRSNVRKMDALLFGLLKLSRSGNVGLNLEPLDMNRLAADVKESFDFKIREAGARIEISDLPACIGDEDQINQVFSNLLGNALKYLSPGRPGIIRISGYREGSGSLYCVEDNGVGIGSGECEKIFNMFYRMDTAAPGEGLGLTIVRKILERHGGSIRVESEKGRGSRFYVALPGEGGKSGADAKGGAGGKSREREMGKKGGKEIPSNE